MINATLPDVSVVVVSWNTRELLARCLESVDLGTAGPLVETIVVDNGSTDGSPEMVAERFPRTRLIRNGANRGFAAANNQALKSCTGRYALLLNSDAVLLDDSLSHMVGFLDGHPEAGAAGGRLLNPDGSFQWSYADFPSLFGELLLLTKLYRLLRPPTYPSYPPERSREARAVDWVSGACLIVRRTAIALVGLLDEEYFMYSEEVDWCYRLRRAGWAVYYLPDAPVAHWSGQSAASAPERRRLQVYRSKRLFFRKHRGLLVARLFDLCVRVVSVAKLLLWTASAVAPGREARRVWASSQVRSYRALLGEL
jgi:N-acetylglucosaminyl-diphospho-decaprenol L-rhamnosyltransferase